MAYQSLSATKKPKLHIVKKSTYIIKWKDSQQTKYMLRHWMLIFSRIYERLPPLKKLTSRNAHCLWGPIYIKKEKAMEKSCSVWHNGFL